MEEDTIRIASEKTSGNTFGRMCFIIMYHFLAPMDLVRSTYCCSLTDRVCARMMRAVLDHPVRPMTRMIFQMLFPRIAASTMQNGSHGRTRKKSVIRISRLSTQPPIYPAAMPINVPNTMEMTVAVSPTNRELLAPFTR